MPTKARLIARPELNEEHVPKLQRLMDIIDLPKYTRVIESRNPAYPVGSHIYGHFGWRTHTLVPDAPADSTSNTVYPCPDTGAHSRSLALGCLGRVGLSAYYGLLDIGALKPGEIVLVSGAAGAVGSLVGQIARLRGASRVVGIAGSAEKCRWLCEELGFDASVDYHGDDFGARLKAAVPDGVDVYFDNVGGMVSWHAMNALRPWGRIALCGAIASYNAGEEPVLVPQFNNFRLNLRMEAFSVDRWSDERWFAGLQRLREWLVAGELRYRETVTEGFGRMPEAFVSMMGGGNVGKAIVRA